MKIGFIMAKMGFQFGLESGSYCKRQFRWLLEIPDVVADTKNGGVNALPPEKGARPNLSFKEMEAKHLHEDAYYPAKPEWKPITITVFDLVKNKHPVFEWVKKIYTPNANSVFKEPNSPGFIKTCTLSMYDGCGNTVESWIFEDSWCSAANFQTLDMTSNGVMMCEITLRYMRAYIN